MSIGTIIYRILIGPLELLFETIFVIAERHVDNPAFAIIILSLTMNFLVLPLYRRADAVQAEERDREKELAPWIKHIKKTFKGDERFMMLQALYRENNYKPSDSLKGTLSLLLEIPFFIAAYRFLSGLEILKGVQFGPIADLGAPDALLNIGTHSINILPILMTLINVISAAIYMKGFPLKSKIQMYGVAAIFLVFLYKSPAGLVFYWTLNNLFSLAKNIFYKIKHPEKTLATISAIAGGVLLVIVLLVKPSHNPKLQIAAILLAVCMLIPAMPRRGKLEIASMEMKDANTLFYASCAFLAILTGALIPTALIGDSTQEFINITNYYSPFWYIVSSLSIAVGTFLVWFTIFYRLANDEGKKIFSIVTACAAAVAATNYMFFGKNYGNISGDLVFDEAPRIKPDIALANLAVILLVIIAVSLISIKKTTVVKAISVAMCLSVLIMSGINVSRINKDLSAASSIINKAKEAEPKITLSKRGKNVVIIMMDRQIGHYIPFIMHEKPELKKTFDGFTNYTNAFSYGTYTNVGSPGIFGGYDYIPSEMNKRKEMKLVEKHNEALKVMPRLFSEEGYHVTVLDPTYAGYGWIPDLTIYNDIKGVKTGITNQRYSLPELSYTTDSEAKIELLKRNLFAYAMFKVSPTAIQDIVYNGGNYNAANRAKENKQTIINTAESEGMNSSFLNAYAVLCNLNNITHVDNKETNTFLMMSNDLTHEPMLLQEPEFIPREKVDNVNTSSHYYKRTDDSGNSLNLETENQITHYQTNVAAMLKLGEWLEHLQSEGVYDNTRIIIVSDHGRDLADNIAPVIEFKNNKGEEAYMDSSFFNCTLMVKDFEKHGFEHSNEQISNADTPAVATEGLINNPINPYTGNRLESFVTQDKEPELIYTFDWQTNKNNGNTFLPANWFTVKGNIYNKENWDFIGFY